MSKFTTTNPTPQKEARQPIDDLAWVLAENAVKTPILVMTSEDWPGKSYICIDEFMDVDLSWADDLDVTMDKDSNGKPQYHPYSDIAVDERNWLNSTVLEPLFKKALLSLTDDDLMMLKLLRERK